MTLDQPKEWLTLWSNSDGITEIEVPRYSGNENCWLLGFCNVSKDTYATTVYLHTGNSGNIFVHLLYSNTKLAPKKNSISSARLELLAVLIGIKVYEVCQTKIHLKIEKNIKLADSQWVLNWVKNNKPRSIFSKNWIDEIRSEPDAAFKYISTNDNSADIQLE